ncbi:hypothetical protein Tco_0691402 [Tanacetum coccineum]
MTRSSTKELFTPFKDPEREFRSSRKHFKTLSLDESRSPDFDLFSDQEEYSEEEVAETMAETMEQYMSKTRADYGSGVARPKIEDKDNFELKGQFLKELRTNTFSGSDHEDANEHIEKVLEIVDLFHIPNITIDQVMLRAFPMSLTRAVSPHYTKDCPLKEEGKTLEEAYYTQFGVPFQGGGYRATALGFYQRNNANHSYQKQRQSMEENLRKFIREFPKRHEENSNLIIEIRASTDAAIRNQRASIKTLEIQIGKISKVLQKRGFGSLSSSTETNPRDHVKSISTIVEVDASSIRRIGSHKYDVSTEQNSTLIFIILIMPEDIKVPFGRPFLSTDLAKIDVFKRKINLRVGEEKIIFKSVKHASSLIKRVYMLSLREKIELDLEARLMGKTLVLNRSLDHFFGDYIELNDLNVPLELRRDQVDDLMPTIKEGEVIEEFRAKNDARLVSEIFRYPSDCDHDKKIRIDGAHNLKFSCMIGFEFLYANFFPILYINVMSKKFYNSIRKDKLEYKGNNVVEALMNIPISVGTFSILTDFALLEDMDAYRDEGIDDVNFGEPFLREVRINARRFEGMITIHNGNEEVTYQMVRSHPRFKNYTNEQYNKIPSLLMVGKEDMMNEISHSYQMLKSFYKGVLNLGPEYVRDAKMEEWLTRGHISVHEME